MDLTDDVFSKNYVSAIHDIDVRIESFKNDLKLIEEYKSMISGNQIIKDEDRIKYVETINKIHPYSYGHKFNIIVDHNEFIKNHNNFVHSLYDYMSENLKVTLDDNTSSDFSSNDESLDVDIYDDNIEIENMKILIGETTKLKDKKDKYKCKKCKGMYTNITQKKGRCYKCSKKN